jgi:hypothetical protein
MTCHGWDPGLEKGTKVKANEIWIKHGFLLMKIYDLEYQLNKTNVT